MCECRVFWFLMMSLVVHYTAVNVFDIITVSILITRNLNNITHDYGSLSWDRFFILSCHWPWLWQRLWMWLWSWTLLWHNGHYMHYQYMILSHIVTWHVLRFDFYTAVTDSLGVICVSVTKLWKCSVVSRSEIHYSDNSVYYFRYAVYYSNNFAY